MQLITYKEYDRFDACIAILSLLSALVLHLAYYYKMTNFQLMNLKIDFTSLSRRVDKGFNRLSLLSNSCDNRFMDIEKGLEETDMWVQAIEEDVIKHDKQISITEGE